MHLTTTAVISVVMRINLNIVKCSERGQYYFESAMKPIFDLDDPGVNKAIEILRAQMEKALNVPQRVESAVLPIFFTLKSLTKPEQVGTGVAFCIKNEHFIFSASHVFHDISSYALLVGTGGGERLAVLSGERFSTKKGPSGTHIDDPIDASVFHIQSGLTDQIKDVALSFNDLDLTQPDQSHSVFMAAGFRSKKSRTINNEAKGKRECFPSVEYGELEYSSLGLHKTTHIALAYEDKVLINGGWQTSPSPKGISGGAIIKVEGVNLRPPFSSSQQPRQLLSAITIEMRREKDGRPGVLIGTRVGVHLGLIDQYIPGLITPEDLNEKSN